MKNNWQCVVKSGGGEVSCVKRDKIIRQRSLHKKSWPDPFGCLNVAERHAALLGEWDYISVAYVLVRSTSPTVGRDRKERRFVFGAHFCCLERQLSCIAVLATNCCFHPQKFSTSGSANTHVRRMKMGIWRPSFTLLWPWVLARMRTDPARELLSVTWPPAVMTAAFTQLLSFTGQFIKCVLAEKFTVFIQAGKLLCIKGRARRGNRHAWEFFVSGPGPFGTVSFAYPSSLSYSD